jgi:hypothetical protein
MALRKSQVDKVVKLAKQTGQQDPEQAKKTANLLRSAYRNCSPEEEAAADRIIFGG